MKISLKRRESKKTELSIGEKVNHIEKELMDLQRHFKKCDYLKVIEKYHSFQSSLIAMVGIVLTVVTIIIAIPTIINIITYDEKITELEAMIHTQKYLTLANDAQSDEKRIEYFTAAIEHDNENPLLYLRRGEAHFWCGNYEEAIEDCSKAIEYDANYEDAFYLRGQIYYENEKYELAIKDFDNLLSLYNEEEKNAYIACSYYYIENYEKALQYFDATSYGEVDNISKDPEYENLYFLSSICYQQLKDYTNAANSLSIYLARKCKDVEEVRLAAGRLIDIYYAMNDQESANFIINMIEQLNAESQEKNSIITNNPSTREKDILTMDDTLYNELCKRVDEIRG